MPRGSEYTKVFTGDYPLSVREFPNRIDNPAPSEAMVANALPEPTGLHNLRLQRQRDEMIRMIFHRALGGKGEPPPLTPIQSEVQDIHDDIYERALRAGYKELPDEEGYFRPERKPSRGREIPLRRTKEGRPFLDPLYANPGVA